MKMTYITHIKRVISVLILMIVVSLQAYSVNAVTIDDSKLSNLGIKPYDFYGFEEDILIYTVAVPESVEEIEIYAESDSDAEITGTGDMLLEDGKNTYDIIVTGSSGSITTYTINIIKDDDEYDYLKKIGSSGVLGNIGEGLESLNIEGIELDKEFDTNVYEYEASYEGDSTELKIDVETTKSVYNTEIVGNTEIEEGENVVTILVTDDKGLNVATYQIIVEKAYAQLQIFETEGTIFENIDIKYIYGFWIVIGILIVFIIIRKIIKNIKKNKRSAMKSKVLEEMERYNEDTYCEEEYDSTTEDENIEENEVPKGLRNKREESKATKGKRYK